MESSTNKEATVYQVFTPAKRAKRTFVDRHTELNNNLVDALMTPGMQVIVYGHTGSGKTSLLLKKLDELYDEYIVTRCVSGTSVDEIILKAFDKLDVFYNQSKREGVKSQWKLDFGLEYEKVKAAMGYSKQSSDISIDSTRAVPLQINPERLGEFLGRINACWVIEDFHKVDEKEKKKIAQIMKIFVDLADEHTKVKIALLGAVETAREIVKLDKELKNRVAEIHVPLMTESQIRQIITKGEKEMNIDFGNFTRENLPRLSNGLASVCHKICLTMCQSLEIYEPLDTMHYLTKNDFDNSIKRYLSDNSDTIKDSFERITKSSRNSKYNSFYEILSIVARSKSDDISFSEIFKRIKRTYPKYQSHVLNKYLKQLTSPEKDEVLRYSKNSDRYSFNDPLFKAYFLCHLDETKRNERRKLVKASPGFVLSNEKVNFTLFAHKFFNIIDKYSFEAGLSADENSLDIEVNEKI